jgi:hypothetical protein
MRKDALRLVRTLRNFAGESGFLRSSDRAGFRGARKAPFGRRTFGRFDG